MTSLALQKLAERLAKGSNGLLLGLTHPTMVEAIRLEERVRAFSEYRQTGMTCDLAHDVVLDAQAQLAALLKKAGVEI